MRTQFIIILLTIAFGNSFAQDYPINFGKIPQAEVDLEQCSWEESAEAIVLFDIGNSKFEREENSFKVIFERTTRIKIFNEAGLKYAEIEIPFYQEGYIYEKVYDIEANIYNYEDGRLKVTKYDCSNYHDEIINNSWKVRKLALPEVKAGSIIEYKYAVSSQYISNLRDWEFQWEIPVEYSEYTVNMIPFYSYTYLMQGASKFDVFETYEKKTLPRQFGNANFHDVVSKFGMKRIPGFKDEEFITSKKDYIIKIDFQLSEFQTLNGAITHIKTTWPELKRSLNKSIYFGSYLKKSQNMAPKILNLDSLMLLSPEKRLDEIVSIVKSNVNWNGFSNKYSSKSVKDIIKEKHGNTADINLLLTGLLNAAEIEAYPVILSTRENGKLKIDYPFSHFFNYVIVLAKINDKLILTDATETTCKNNRIPPRCINDKGLIIDKKNEVQWVDLNLEIPSAKQTFIQIEFTGDTIFSDVVLKATEYVANSYRRKYSDNKKKIIEKLLDNNESIVDSSIRVNEAYNAEKPYSLRYKMIDNAEIIGNKIYISPFLNKCITENPLKQKERTYPIDFGYSVKYVYNSTIKIPEGYKIDYLPEENKIKNKLFELDYKITEMNGIINISFIYQFKNTVYAPSYLPEIRYNFNEIVKCGNDKIVLIKK